MHKRYVYSYQTVVRFSGNVTNHFIKLRCLPCENSCQRILKQALTVYPEFRIQEGKDNFGNRILTGSMLEEHNGLTYISSGEVELAEYSIPDSCISPMYLIDTEKTRYCRPMDAVRPISSGNQWLRAWELCTELNKYMTYSPGATGVSTTASRAFEQRRGVCQDYAHILISLCHHYGIPARYVNGFIEGEGATHAWVEVFIATPGTNGKEGSWRGLDPTHGIYIEHGYIKLAHGRDAGDCPVSRGVYTGITNQQTEIKVLVNQ